MHAWQPLILRSSPLTSYVVPAFLFKKRQLPVNKFASDTTIVCNLPTRYYSSRIKQNGVQLE